MYRCIPVLCSFWHHTIQIGCLRTRLLTVLHAVHAIGRSLAQARRYGFDLPCGSHPSAVFLRTLNKFSFGTQLRQFLLVGTLPEDVTSINSPNYSCTLIGSRL